ncbi:MAG TPA: DNA-3-methyladenine glycosylase I [Steroidobacteraceae bacterium]|nr:DNA-3-methyladenine glycosylase I [Steroidobacteraceae bacterium]
MSRPRRTREGTDGRRRCWWAADGDADYVRYHDREWGRPVHDEQRLFEMLTLEGAQAGLSWRTILRKRERYQRVFAEFDPARVARFGARQIAQLLRDPGIVRNRLKIESTVSNARAFLAVQRKFGSFDRYLWQFVQRRALVRRPATRRQVPARSKLSDHIARDLKRRGFRFIGTTIVYAFLQAVGVINDHCRDCFCAPAAPFGRLPDSRSACAPTVRAARARQSAVLESRRAIEGGSVARYSKASSRKVKRAMHERKRGTLRSGSSGKKVTSRKQAIAIGLSEARRAGAHVPGKKTAKKKSSARSSSAKRSRSRS